MYCVLNPPVVKRKARILLNRIYQSLKDRGYPVHMVPEYIPCDVLITYGLGGKDRFIPAMNHLKKGRLITFDVGYWKRDYAHRHFRVSINGFHCPDLIFAGDRPTSERFNKSGFDIHPDHRTKGPIMLVGNAPKSLVVGAKGWAEKKSKEIRKTFKGQKILYRPKPKRPHESCQYDSVSTGPIDQEIKKCSLVVCRHSNVAVDACRLGVPVVCDDGAAASIYPKELRDYQNQPDFETRKEFLHRLAHWQYTIDEVELFWCWLFKTFPAYDYQQLHRTGNSQSN